MNPAIVAATAHILSPSRLARAQPLAYSFIAQRQRYHSPFETKKLCTCRQFSSIDMMTDNISATSGNNVDGEHIMGTTRYRVVSSTMQEGKGTKWVRISFDEPNDTTAQQQNAQKKQKVVDKKAKNSHQQTLPTTQKSVDDTNIIASSQESNTQCIPDSVLQYQRQMRKIKASDRASKTNVNIDDHLQTVYSDDHVVVANKPSGILCVPGVNKHRSLLDLVYDVYGSADAATNENEEQSSSSSSPLQRDQMIVHRLDMDTSGIVIFARTRLAMSKLHASFRERVGTKKIYEALLVGWVDIDKWVESADENSDTIDAGEVDSDSLGGGEINLPLQRDHRHPPFMRVSTPESEAEARQAVKDLNHAGYKKLIAKKPKPSTTKFRILSHEKWMGHPVTRVELTPITGRTHQLRVHCAAMGHPILGDPAYGFCGESHPNGGFSDDVMREMSPTCAAFELRRDLEDAVSENGRTMCLHARQLTLDHPVTNQKVSFEAAPSF